MTHARSGIYQNTRCSLQRYIWESRKCQNRFRWFAVEIGTVWLKLLYGMSNIEISSTLFVSPKTVSRIYRLFTDYLQTKYRSKGNNDVNTRPKGTTTLYDEEELVICEMLLRQPTIHLKEIAHEIEKTTPVLDFLSTACAGQYTGLDLPWIGEFLYQ